MSSLILIVTAIAAITAPQLPQTEDASFIGYFEGSCPGGWRTYQNLSGTVGTGSYSDSLQRLKTLGSQSACASP